MVILEFDLKNQLDSKNIQLVEKNINKLLKNFIKQYDKGKINLSLFKNNFNKLYGDESKFEGVLIFCFSYKITLYEKLKNYGLKKIVFNMKPLDEYIVDNMVFRIKNNKFGFYPISNKILNNLKLFDSGGLKVRIKSKDYILPTMNVIHNFNIEFKRSNICQLCKVLCQQVQDSTN